MRKTDFINKTLERFFQLSGRRWCWFLFVFVLVLSSILSYTIQQHSPYNPDSVAQLFQAKIFANGQLSIEAPPFMEFFSAVFNLEKDGRVLSQFGPGYSFELMLGLLIGIPWIINPLNGALTVVLTYLIGRELFGEKTGKAASLILAYSPFFLIFNGTFMNNSLSLLLCDIFLYFFIFSFKRNDIKSPLIAGLSLGIISQFRSLTVLAFGFPFAIYALVRLYSNVHAYKRTVGLMFVGFSFSLAIYFAFNTIQYGGPFVTGYHLYDQLYRGDDYAVYGFGKHALGGVHTPFRGLVNIVTQLNRLNHSSFLGWPIPGFFFMALLFFLRKRLETWDKLMIATFGSLLFFHFFYYHFKERLMFCCFSMMAIMTVRGVVELIDWLKEKRGQGQEIQSKVALLICAFILFGFANKILPRIIDPTGSQLQLIANTVKKAKLEKPALVFVQGGYENRWIYLTVSQHNSITWDDDVLYPVDLGDEKNKELMGYYPGRLYFRFEYQQDGSGKLLPLHP
jgi:4-amino-4-deoxy-L-arabinose transferase-like glycosyltransferase